MMNVRLIAPAISGNCLHACCRARCSSRARCKASEAGGSPQELPPELQGLSVSEDGQHLIGKKLLALPLNYMIGMGGGGPGNVRS